MCLETSFTAQKQKFLVPRDSTWPLSGKSQSQGLYEFPSPGELGDVSPRLEEASPPDRCSKAAGLKSHRSVPTNTTASPSESTSRIFPSLPKALKKQENDYFSTSRSSSKVNSYGNGNDNATKQECDWLKRKILVLHV